MLIYSDSSEDFLVILCQNIQIHRMQTVKIKDKTFALSYPEAELQKNIRAVANRINEDFASKTPLLLGRP